MEIAKRKKQLGESSLTWEDYKRMEFMQCVSQLSAFILLHYYCHSYVRSINQFCLFSFFLLIQIIIGHQ